MPTIDSAEPSAGIGNVLPIGQLATQSLPREPAEESEVVGPAARTRRPATEEPSSESAEEAAERSAAEGLSVPSLEVGACPLPVPVAFNPGPVDSRPFKADPQDELCGEPGFISDFVYSMKGTESPVLYNIYAALYAVSVMSGRKAWFKWAMGDLFPNLYVLFVGPPSGPHKGAAMGRTGRLLDALPSALVALAGDKLLAEEKRIPCISGRATNEGIYKALAPRRQYFNLPGCQGKTLDFGSRAYVWAPEFATFLNSKKYTEGLVDALTNWYDCLPKDSETLSTRTRKPLHDIYFCLAGALTPMHLATSIPQEAFTGGFMSRTLIVNQERPFELFYKPCHFTGYPTEEDLVSNLCWLAYNDRGPYDFTPGADAFYHDFYMESREKTLSSTTDIHAYARLRHEHLVIRIAMLLRMCEYREGRDVTVRNIQEAIRLLEYTYSTQKAVAEMVGADEQMQAYLKVRRFLAIKGEISRQTLQRHFSKQGVLTPQLNMALEQLVAQGDISMIFNGRPRGGEKVSSDGREVYKWLGGPIDAEEDS